MIYVGIDNGVSGGLCAISDHEGSMLGLSRMPVKQYKGKNEVDIGGVHAWLTEVTGGNLSNARYILEKPVGAQSYSAAVSMAGSFHSLRGFFETKFLPFERITPQSWQKVMLPSGKKKDSKEAELAVALSIWPDESFIPKRCRTPHDGVIDAALIAEHGRREGL